MKFPVQKTLTLALATVLPFAAAHASVVLDFADFSDTTGLTINGNAARVGNVLRVTPAFDGQAGSFFSTNKVSLATGASFSTYFKFQFTNPDTGFCDHIDGLGCGADGLVFVVQTVANNVGGAGGGIGYAGVSNSVGIEFDSWYNGELGDQSSNHVGIDTNGSLSSLKQRFVSEADFNAGNIWNAWVDYNATTTLIEVRLSTGGARPTDAFLSTNIDLATTLGSNEAFIGFTSGTGASNANHDVLSWQLANDYQPIDPGNRVPLPGSVPLLGAGLLALGLARRQRQD